jgi:adenylate cyclase, class 2
VPEGLPSASRALVTAIRDRDRHGVAADQAIASALIIGRVDDLEGLLGVSLLRRRTVTGRHYFTLKQPAQNDQACLEYETEVTDGEAMHHAALHMGYRPTVRIVKTRRTASTDGCSLCIDDLEGVGGFIEAERVAPDDADAQAIQAELAALIESLGW